MQPNRLMPVRVIPDVQAEAVPGPVDPASPEYDEGYCAGQKFVMEADTTFAEVARLATDGRAPDVVVPSHLRGFLDAIGECWDDMNRSTVDVE